MDELEYRLDLLQKRNARQNGPRHCSFASQDSPSETPEIIQRANGARESN